MEIGKLKSKLNRLIKEQESLIVTNEIIKISQLLDEALNRYKRYE
jgi:hypothetical protein